MRFSSPAESGGAYRPSQPHEGRGEGPFPLSVVNWGASFITPHPTPVLLKGTGHSGIWWQAALEETPGACHSPRSLFFKGPISSPRPYGLANRFWGQSILSPSSVPSKCPWFPKAYSHQRSRVFVITECSLYAQNSTRLTSFNHHSPRGERIILPISR